MPRYWVIDHDHETDKFRGHVCKSCNNAIGLLGDNLKGVMNVVKYFKSRGEKTIDIAITPNRPDCLGVRGIARDLASSGLGQLKKQPSI